MALPIKLAPPETKPHTSVARHSRAWYVACRSSDLRPRKPLAITLLGVPVALFRGEGGEAGALVDRCPHRNVPLSQGKVVGPHLQCPYHGWQFDPQGACRLIPGLLGEPDGKGRRAQAYPVKEQDGYVWVWTSLEHPPEGEPFPLPFTRAAGYTTIHRQVELEASLHSAVENALDVPHTAFLHAGLFRGTGKTNDIDVVVKRTATQVEAEYLGEPRPEGLVGKLLAPGGGTTQHFDRFVLPSVAQVEYRLSDRAHILVTSLCTPVEDFYTRMFAVVSFKLPLPGWLVRLALQPIAMRIFKQDAVMLKEQTAIIRKFGGERYASTEIDILGSHIWRLLKAAETGDVATDTEDRVRMHV